MVWELIRKTKQKKTPVSLACIHEDISAIIMVTQKSTMLCPIAKAF